MPHALLLTEDRYEHPSGGDPYVVQLLREEALVAEALARRGWTSERVAWSRPDVDWQGASFALFRSTWDYFHRWREFQAWLDRVEPLVPLVNDARLVRWNADKHYLGELSRSGVPIVPTQYVEPAERVTLAQLRGERTEESFIIKPAISGAARHTYRITSENWRTLAPTVDPLLAAESFLVQPFHAPILEQGEWSLIVVGGRVTHGVSKRARPGDFRVQDDHGGVSVPHGVSDEERDFAQRVVAACRPEPHYARVDVVRGTDDTLWLMELELIEPELFFRFAPESADALAESICQRVSR